MQYRRGMDITRGALTYCVYQNRICPRVFRIYVILKNDRISYLFQIRRHYKAAVPHGKRPPQNEGTISDNEHQKHSSSAIIWETFM